MVMMKRDVRCDAAVILYSALSAGDDGICEIASNL